MSPVYLITGVTGSGKSSIGAALTQMGYTVFDLDALSCWRNKETGKCTDADEAAINEPFLKAHDWFCSPVLVRSAIDHSAISPRPVFFVGVTSNMSEYMGLFSKIFLLACSRRTIADRLRERREGFGTTPDQLTSVMSWHAYFERTLIEQGAIPLQNDGEMMATIQQILDQTQTPALVLPSGFGCELG